jgi:hypothetical protein
MTDQIRNSYTALVLHKLLYELFFIEIRPVTAELLSVLCLVPFLYSVSSIVQGALENSAASISNTNTCCSVQKRLCRPVWAMCGNGRQGRGQGTSPNESGATATTCTTSTATTFANSLCSTCQAS